MDERQPSYERQRPSIKTAVFCERVLEDKSGLLSLINVLDKLTYVLDSDQRDQDPAFLVQVAFVLMLDGFGVTGEHKFTFHLESPSGASVGPPVELATELDGEKDQNWTIRLNVKATEAGMYWAVVGYEGREFTRRRLNVQYVQALTRRESPRRS